MTDQAGMDLRSGAGMEEGAHSDIAPASPGHYEPFHGRPVSWVAVSIIMLGFLVGGLALVFGTIWWLFWTGLGLAWSAACWPPPPTSSKTGTKARRRPRTGSRPAARARSQRPGMSVPPVRLHVL